MYEAIALLILYVLYVLPWENPYLIGAYLLLAIGAVLYLCAAIVHRFAISKHLRHRIGDPTNKIENTQTLSYDEAEYADEDSNTPH